MRTSSKIRFLLLFFTLFLSLPLAAQEYDLEKEAKTIEGLFMSPCCWGGTVAEHNSQAAIDIKQGIREMLKKGKNRMQILAFYEEKFGERILSAPKKSGFNLLVWILPFVIFILGLFIVLFFLRRMKPVTEQANENASSVDKEKTISDEDEKYHKQIDDELYG